MCSGAAVPFWRSRRPIGRLISLRFALSGDHDIRCRAVVRNRPGGNGVGLEFVELSAEHRRLISDCVEQLQSARFPDADPRD